MLSLGEASKAAIKLLMLLQEQERRYRMRAQPDETRHPSSKHPRDAFRSVHVDQQGPHAFALLGAHDARLDDVHGAADGGGDEAGQEAGAEVRGEVIVQWRVGEYESLEAVVRGELGCRHQDRTHAVRQYAPEKGPPSFLPCHAHQAVDGVFVVAAGGGGQGGVVLHADVEDVGGVAGDAAEEAGGGCHGDEGGEGRGCSGGGGGGFELFVDAEAGGGVGQLAEEGGRELGYNFSFGGVWKGVMGEIYAAVEAEEAVVAEDMDESVEHAARAIGGACLEADLNLCQRLNECRQR